MKIFISLGLVLSSLLVQAQTSTSDAWINEFHYDGMTSYGTADVNEFVEIAMKTTLAANPVELAKYKLVLYSSGAPDATALNLGRGLPYNIGSSWYSVAETEHSLSSFQQCPISGTAFTLLSKSLPILQDLPAAFALMYNNTVVQLLSYEKSFKIAPVSQNGGPAAGLITELIAKANGKPAMETATTATNHSVSLLGAGTSYNNFTWDDSTIITATPCALNTNGVTTQSFAVVLPVTWLNISAQSQKNNIHVQWQLAIERDIDYYEVELENAQQMFEVIGKVFYNKANNGSYQYTMAGIKPGSYKVRVRAIAKDGTPDYSATRLVKVTGSSMQLVSIYPNPVAGKTATLQILPAEKTNFMVRLVNMDGKTVFSTTTPVYQPNVINNFTIPLNVKAGVYQVIINTLNEQQVLKLVVIN